MGIYNFNNKEYMLSKTLEVGGQEVFQFFCTDLSSFDVIYALKNTDGTYVQIRDRNLLDMITESNNENSPYLYDGEQIVLALGSGQGAIYRTYDNEYIRESELTSAFIYDKLNFERNLRRLFRELNYYPNINLKNKLAENLIGYGVVRDHFGGAHYNRKDKKINFTTRRCFDNKTDRMHEMFHAFTCNIKTLRFGVNFFDDSGASIGRGLNEGITEYFAAKLAGQIPAKYPEQVKLVKKLVKQFGERELLKAAIEGPKNLQLRFDRIYGKNAFVQMNINMDNELYLKNLESFEYYKADVSPSRIKQSIYSSRAIIREAERKVNKRISITTLKRYFFIMKYMTKAKTNQRKYFALKRESNFTPYRSRTPAFATYSRNI